MVKGSAPLQPFAEAARYGLFGECGVLPHQLGIPLSFRCLGPR